MSQKHERHGHTANGAPSPEYVAWNSMIERCTNPNHKGYKRYGKRGITVCQRWLNSFKAFLDDVGLRPSPSHSIDRLENTGNYEPGNVAWRTLDQQSRNRRTNVVITYRGRTQVLLDWSRELGISYQLIRYRMHKLGMTFEQAVETPVRRRRTQ